MQKPQHLERTCRSHSIRRNVVSRTISTALLLAAIILIAPVPAFCAEPGGQTLAGHVPAVVAGLTPKGRLPTTNHIHLAIGLPLLGILSMPASYLLLERMKLAVVPQFQPMRAVLFITVMAALLAAIAACVAVRAGRFGEAVLWLLLAYLIPTNNRVLELPSLIGPLFDNMAMGATLLTTTVVVYSLEPPSLSMTRARTV